MATNRLRCLKSFSRSSCQITSNFPSLDLASSTMNYLSYLTGMKPVAYGSYFVQMLTNSVRLYFAMGKSKWYV